MTSAKGSFDFLRRLLVVGIAFNVERTYLGGQLAVGEFVALVYRVIEALGKKKNSKTSKLATRQRCAEGLRWVEE